MSSQLLSEYRCTCGKLLFKGVLVVGIIEIKCKRCNAINTIHAVTEDIISTDGFAFLADEQGHIVSASKSAATGLGYTIPELLRLSVDDISTRSAAATSVRFPMILRDAPREIFEKMSYKKRDGSVVAAATRCVPISTGSSALLLMVANTNVGTGT